MVKDISLNFGAIRDSVLKLSAAEFINENESKSLDAFTNFIKKSPVLRKQHLIFKNFETCKPFEKERLAERFIAQNLSVLHGIKWIDVVNENRSLRLSLLSENHVEAKQQNAKLFESVHTLIESMIKGVQFVNIEREQEAYEYVLNHLTRKETISEIASKEKNDYPDLKSWKFITKLAVNNFNERYEHLNEEERKVFGILISDDEKKKNYLEDLKKENIVLIDKVLSETKKEEKEKVSILESFKTKVDGLNSINHYDIDNSILACIELKETLSEIK